MGNEKEEYVRQKGYKGGMDDREEKEKQKETEKIN